MRAALLALTIAFAMPALSEAPSSTLVEVDFTNPGLSPSHWTLTLEPDGSGHFRSERGNHPVTGLENMDPPSIDRDIHVSAEFAGRVFQAAHRHNLFNETCDSRAKVAFTGWKKLTYTGPEGTGSCRFNFAQEKDMQDLGERLVAVAGTIVEGARIEALLQHDPLGLDRETEYLVEAAGDGRAQQIGVIRGILERLAQDETVMERVRRRARVLLARSDSPNG